VVIAILNHSSGMTGLQLLSSSVGAWATNVIQSPACGATECSPGRRALRPSPGIEAVMRRGAPLAGRFNEDPNVAKQDR
jgi:hypothetical protein